MKQYNLFCFGRAILPFSQVGMFIERTSAYIKIKAKLGLVAIWNEEDSFLVRQWLHRRACHNHFFKHCEFFITVNTSKTHQRIVWKSKCLTLTCLLKVLKYIIYIILWCILFFLLFFFITFDTLSFLANFCSQQC